MIIKNKRIHIRLLPVYVFILLTILLIKTYCFYSLTVYGENAIININFLLPMRQKDIENNIRIYPQTSEIKVSYDYKWKNSSTLIIHLKELGETKGLNINLKIYNMETNIGIKKNFSKNIQFICQPEVIDISPKDNLSTIGNIDLIFNTFIEEKNIKKYIEFDTDYDITPHESIINKAIVKDYSKWQLHPKVKLDNKKIYQLKIKKGLKAKNGERIIEDKTVKITTSKKPKILSIIPENNSKWVSVYPKIIVMSDEIIKKGTVMFQGNKGKVTIKENTLEFLPQGILDSNKEYNAIIQIENEHGEKSEKKHINFKTMPLDRELLWVEVALGNEQKVMVHEGQEIIKTMKCSGGTKEEPTVTGTFYIRDRGEEFFSHRFGEGATYWVRFYQQYLFHGIPRNKEWNIIEKELNKLGQPASHGCVRLSEEDAKWFYENIPHKTMVIIHE